MTREAEALIVERTAGLFFNFHTQNKINMFNLFSADSCRKILEDVTQNPQENIDSARKQIEEMAKAMGLTNRTASALLMMQGVDEFTHPSQIVRLAGDIEEYKLLHLVGICAMICAAHEISKDDKLDIPNVPEEDKNRLK